ncbi:MAG: beta-lactamase family protein [bacterium]|nr:beta-lactamase family protein [bacterium]
MNKIMQFVSVTFVVCSSLSLALAQPVSQVNTVDIGQGFIDGVNADSPEVRTAIAREIYASSTLTEVGEERLVALFDKIRGNYGLLAYHHSEQTGEYLHLYAQSVNDKQWRDFQFKLSSEPSPKLRNIVFIADVAEPIYLPNGSIDNQHTLDWLSSYVEKLNKENDLAAAVLVAKGDSIIFERYIGYADAARTRPIGPHARMNLGSGNKMFTALAIMQLRDAGKLRLTDTLVSYFPDYPHQEYIRSATIHHLLSHTSGSGDYWTDAYEAAWDSISSLDQMMPFVLLDTPAFAPGTQFQYSNSGFILAGKIIEQVTGQNYYDYVREHIYRPLSMSETGSFLKSRADTLLAEPLTRSKDGWVTARHGLRGSSAGGGYSTPAISSSL